MTSKSKLHTTSCQTLPGKLDTSCQDRLLPHVSRSFALTIPQLPAPLRTTVTNAYLLCRIADTVEDDGEMDHDTKSKLHSILVDVIAGLSKPDEFIAPCLEHLSSGTPIAERELVKHTAQIVSLTHSFRQRQRTAIQECLEIMCAGMSAFSRHRNLHGLPTMTDFNRYCYVVAGCVGEMLTELFCDYSPEIGAQRARMMPLAVSFGQGLQMTNILKDVWDDREHNACWLPRSVFAGHGINLTNLPAERENPALRECLDLMISIAHNHLRCALQYTQLLPTSESGIRNFCLWAIGLAILTLRNIHNSPKYSSGHEVKVSRRALRGVIATSSVLGRSNGALSLAFSLFARGLPHVTASRAGCVITKAPSWSAKANAGALINRK